jgi:hypothetical protein
MIGFDWYKQEIDFVFSLKIIFKRYLFLFLLVLVSKIFEFKKNEKKKEKKENNKYK